MPYGRGRAKGGRPPLPGEMGNGELALRFQGPYRVLQALVQEGRASARELAVALRVTPVTVRLHLRRLRAEGLAEVVTRRTGRPGHPERVWAATPEGRVLVLPRRHVELSGLVWLAVKERWGSAGLTAVMDRAARRYVSRLALPLAPTLAERREQLLRSLAGLGVPAQWEGEGELTLLGTVYPADVARDLPEAFAFYRAMAEAILEVPCRLDTRVKPPAACALHLLLPR